MDSDEQTHPAKQPNGDGETVEKGKKRQDEAQENPWQKNIPPIIEIPGMVIPILPNIDVGDGGS